MPHPGGATSSSASGAPWKAMRKGTHSCFECRRRKKRCILSPDDPTTCVRCESKGTRCTEQLQNFPVDTRLNLKDRVAKLEAIIQSLAPGGSDVVAASGDTRSESLPNTPRSWDSKIVNEKESFSTPSILGSVPLGPDIGQKIGPISSLFNNAIWRSKDPDKGAATDEAEFGVSLSNLGSKANTKRARTREALLSRLPAPELLGDILNTTCSWWYTWLPLGHSLSEKKWDSLQEFVVWAFNSDDPSIVALATLCVSVSIQQLSNTDHHHIIAQLPRPPGTLVQEYFAQVDTLIVNDSDYASTREGIEVILLSAKTLMNLGLIKKTWILYHRAVSYCQLLGLHRPQQLFERETDEEKHQRHLSWVSVSNADVYLSLLLGLPYASDCRTIPMSFFGDQGTLPWFSHNLSTLSVRVIDRNQAGLSLSTELANQIQLEIESVDQAMDSDFWDCATSVANGSVTRSGYFEQITSQFWYHQLKVSLHMPLMIQSVENHELEGHRLACLESSRDLLKTYRILRTDTNSAFNMVKVIDYQAFICAALLVLGVLGYGSSPSADQSIKRAQDIKLVDGTVDILRQAAGTSNNNIASQAVQGLETLSSLIGANDCARNLKEGHCATPLVKIVVPYAGTIMIAAGEFLKSQKNLQHSSQPILNPPPVFTLSHGIFQTFQEHLATPPNIGSQASAQNNIQSYGSDLLPEVTSIDFEWGSMVNMTAEDDWAWLNDVSNNGMNGFM